jgi:hypothetical protein
MEGAMKRWSTFSVVFGLALMLAACGKPVPQEKIAYVGEWRAKTMYLLIAQDGSVQYKRVKDGITTTVNAPLKDFHGQNFEVGIGPMSTNFEVSKPPYQEGGHWKMVVDGMELTRTD